MDIWGRVFEGARLFSRGVARQRGCAWASGPGFVAVFVGSKPAESLGQFATQGIPLKRAFSRGVVSFTPPRHRCGVHYGFSRWLMWLDGVFEVGHVISCHLPFLCKWRVHSVSLPRNSATLSSIPCQHDYYCTYCSVLKPETSCLTGAFGPAVIWRQGSKVLPNFGRELWEISHLFVWPSEVTAAKKRSFFGRPRERCPRYMSNGFIKSSSWKASDYENEDFVAGGVWVLWKDFMSMYCI